MAHIINRGGTIFYTARSDEFRTEEGQKKAVATCKLLGSEGVVAIGVDGTFRGCLALSKHGIPGTIDNDIGCTHYSIGYDTAANTAVEAIDRFHDPLLSPKIGMEIFDFQQIHTPLTSPSISGQWHRAGRRPRS